MPIEKIFDTGNKVSSTSKRLEREDYWCRELCTFYPYGLNDNVRGVGNISKMKGQGQLVVNMQTKGNLECANIAGVGTWVI